MANPKGRIDVQTIILVIAMIGSVFFVGGERLKLWPVTRAVRAETNVVAQSAKSFSMQAKRFEFVPSTITVSKGDTVELTVTSLDVTHGLSISEFGVNETIPAGESKTITFLASKAGTFSMVCSVFCGSGHGSMSAVLVVEESSEQTNEPDTQAPSAPQNLSGSATSAQIDLNWDASTDNVGVKSYVLFRNGTSVGTPTVTSVSDGGLTPGTSYKYQVTAIDAAGNESEKSTSLSISTLPLADETAPTASNILETQVSTSSAKISWTTDEKSIGQVEYGVQSGSFTAATPWEGSSTTRHSVELSGLTAGTNYFYRIKNTDERSNLGISTERQFQTAEQSEVAEDRNAPKISAVSATVLGQTEATIAFQTNEPAKAFVEFGLETGDYSDSMETSALATTHSLTLRELDAGTIYYYRVKATDAAGNFEFSSQQIFTTVAATGSNTNTSQVEDAVESDENADDDKASGIEKKDADDGNEASKSTESLAVPVLEFVEVNQAVIPLNSATSTSTEQGLEDLSTPTAFSSKEGESILFKGKTIPDATVTLRIRSDPFEVTTVSDAAGNWSYTLTQPLEAGEHSVEVAVRNQDGEESSFSNPLRFTVEAAAEEPAASIEGSAESESSLGWNVVIIVAALLLGGLGFALHYFKQRLKPPVS